jgi:predicted N-formylglutamate amidohydrolase
VPKPSTVPSPDVLTEVPGDPATGLLLIADHASARVPEGIVLGVSDSVMAEHVAIDIGVDPLGRALCATLGCPALLAAVSRLVIDLNREEDSPGLIPAVSDGHVIPGNALDAAGSQARIDRFFRPYHAALADRIARDAPRLIVSLHSFTPQLRGAPDQARPWQIGILYNRDDRAARISIPLLEAAGISTGDNLPYSGQVLNATMNRHAEANGIPYLGIEVRQDLIGDAAGVARWCAVLAPVIAQVLRELGKGGAAA